MISRKIECFANTCKHSQGKHVDLQEPKCFDIIFIPFNACSVFHSCIQYRAQMRQLAFRNHKSTCMLTKLPGKSHELRSKLEYFDQCGVVGIEALFGKHLSFDPIVGKLPDGTRKPADGIDRKTHGLAYITDGTTMVLLRDRCNNGCPMTSILPVYVLNDLFTTFMLEVDIDIRWFVSRRRNEALEKQIEVRRINGSYTKTITHS